MVKLESQTSKEATWRNHLARHFASGKSIAAFIDLGGGVVLTIVRR